MAKYISDISYSELSEALEVRDGLLYWKVQRGLATVGAAAGRIDREGYRALRFLKRDLLAHRVVWLLTYGTWPNGPIDHKNGIRTDNRIENLREATHSQNAMNRGLCKAGIANGGKGITRLPSGKWQAQICANGKRMHLGTFEDKYVALDRYKKVAEEIFGEFERSERSKP